MELLTNNPKYLSPRNFLCDIHKRVGLVASYAYCNTVICNFNKQLVSAHRSESQRRSAKFTIAEVKIFPQTN